MDSIWQQEHFLLKWTSKLCNKEGSPYCDQRTEKRSERNEQDGIRYMLMGFFQGPRNLYQDNHIGSGVSNTISVIIEASFFLHLLDGRSITQNGRWITKKVDYREIYQKVPKRIDRWKLVRLLKKNHCCTQMRWNYGTNDFVLPDNQHSR